jgi:hypothetical protein
VRRCFVLPLLTLFAMCLIAAPAAQADGDPASDVLLLQDVYLPYAPGVGPAYTKTITDLLKATRKKGFALKVAVIAQPKDLGAVPQFFGKPQSYAPFLQSEIAFNSKKPLLVVMPAGYGAVALPVGTQDALQGLAPPKSASGEDLGRATVAAIVKLAAAAGHPVPAPKLPTSTGGGGGGTSPLIVFGVPVLLLALGGALAAAKRRQDERQPNPERP